MKIRQTGFKINSKLWRYSQNKKLPRYHDIMGSFSTLPPPISVPSLKYVCYSPFPSHFCLLCLLRSLWITWFSWALSSKLVSPPDNLGFYAYAKTTIFSVKYLLESSIIMHSAQSKKCHRDYLLLCQADLKSLGTSGVLASTSQIQGAVTRFQWDIQKLTDT